MFPAYVIQILVVSVIYTCIVSAKILRSQTTYSQDIHWSRKLHQSLNESEQDIEQVEWWKKANYYHIYVRSFKDSNNDGQGDLGGIIEKLDYLKMIGIDTILMAPIYESPMKDGGYDITNHTALNPTYGTMDEFDQLISGLKERGMKIVMDFVPNHVSIDHIWFQCSRRALIDPACAKYKDYFIWNNSTRYMGKYPSNWINVFGGGPAWKYDEVRKSNYLHQFLPEQADLNLRNHNVREELNEIARFWLRKGVDGLRVDAAPFFFEDDTHWFDEPPNTSWKEGDDPYLKLDHKYTFSYKGTPEVVRDWNQIAKKEFTGDRMTVNEAYASLEQLVKYHGTSPTHRFSDLNFAFTMLGIRKDNISPEMLTGSTMPWYNATRELGWPNENGAINPWLIWCSGNHDNPRRIGVVGKENFDTYMWLAFMMPGSPVIYYGDELGTHDVEMEDIPDRTKNEGEMRRLPFRALMAWTPDGPSAGFSDTKHNWMALARNYKQYNVLTELSSFEKTHLTNFLGIQSVRKNFLETFIFGELHIYKNKKPRDSKGKSKSKIFALARYHKRFGSLMMISNLNNKTCERVHLIDDHAMPEAPVKGRILLANQIVLDLPDEPACKGGLKVRSENQIITVDGLTLAPSQTIIFRYFDDDDSKIPNYNKKFHSR